MQFQVPQFIETEDKIVGPLSLRQFGYVGGAGIVSFLLFFAVKTWVWAVSSVFLAAVALLFAFLKINGQPLQKVLRAAAAFFLRPQIYAWQPEKPRAKKEEELKSSGFEDFLSSIVSGLTLKRTWQTLQTSGPPEARRRIGGKRERFEIFRRLSGAQEVARRVDYR